VEYDGTDFHGFQRQAAMRTVQGVLEERFSRLLGEPIAVTGAGRTDAGVHALGQVVNFRTTRPVPMETLAAVLNRALPEDVKVRRAEEVAETFHARRAARSRTYRYTIVERDTPSPLLGRFALVTAERLDVARMTTAAQGLLGRHDFRAFQASGSAAKSTERTLYRLDCARHGDRVEITAEADAFLYRMVRLLVCALRAVSRGELTAEALQERLRSGERRGLTATAPACGLCLLQVSYEAAGRTETGYY
jgi:tRNA pseudouridine38-40 synthase